MSEENTDPTPIDPAEFASLQKQVEVMGLKNQELHREKKKQGNAVKEAEAATLQAGEDAAKKLGDMEALEVSWKAKLGAREAELNDLLSSHQATITALTVGAKAQEMAASIAMEGTASLLIPHILNRLAVDMEDGKGTVRVLDAEGRPSAATLEDLKDEIINAPEFARVVIGSKASGAGLPGAKGGGAAGGIKRADFDKMNPAQRMAAMKEGKTVTD